MKRSFSTTAIGDGCTINTLTLQADIDACHNAGGGVLTLPPGRYLSATIHLRDNVTLHLAEGATLLGSNRIADYPVLPPTLTRIDTFLNRALVVARGVRNVAITGRGTIDGQGRLGENDFMDDPEHDRQYRPLLVWFDRCEDVRTEGITFQAAGFWTQTYSRCRGGIVDGIRVRDNVNDNNDGCDILDSRDFIVQNCDIDCIDDGICLKSYTAEGCHNITIRRNRVKSLCNAIKTGTDSSGEGFQDILIEDNELWQVGRAGLALETTDGGKLERVVVRNLRMDVVGTPIFLKLGNRHLPTRDAAGNLLAVSAPGSLQDITIENLEATVDNETKPVKERYTADEERLYQVTRPHTSSITGYPGQMVENIRLSNIRIEALGGYGEQIVAGHITREIPEVTTKYPNPDMFGTLPAFGLYVRHARNLDLADVSFISRVSELRPALFFEDVHQAQLREVAHSGNSGGLLHCHPCCSGIKTPFLG